MRAISIPWLYHTSYNTSLQRYLTSELLDGCLNNSMKRLWMWLLKSAPRFLMGLKSGDCAGHFVTGTWFSVRHCKTSSVLWYDILSCVNVNVFSSATGAGMWTEYKRFRSRWLGLQIVCISDFSLVRCRIPSRNAEITIIITYIIDIYSVESILVI